MTISFSHTIPGAPGRETSDRAIAQMCMVGNVLSMANNVELAMEMVIKSELDLTLEQACMVCGPLGGGAKLSLLSSLCEGKDARTSFIEAVRAFQNKAGRNALAHGFITFNDTDEPWEIISRDVKNTFKVRRKKLTEYLNDDFMPAFNQVMAESGFSDQELHDYGRAIANLSPMP